MNKDVIYIEPEDDITDIITKIENAKEKIVALVLPKNAEIFRSVVNMKLISKSGLKSDKSLVLVTSDAAVVKLAAVAKLPITKDLKTVPTIPKLDDLNSVNEVKEPVIDETKDDTETTDDDTAKSDDKAEETKEEVATEKPADEAEEKEVEKEADEEDKDEDDEEDEKEVKKADKKKAKKSGKGGNWFKRHKIIVIITPFLLIALGLGLFWAFAIAPAIEIDVTIRAVKNNFSENITFTTKIDEEDSKNGKFYLEEKKLETPVKVEFKATGTKNIGEKATGEVVAIAYFKKSGSISINTGSSFSIKGLFFTSTENVVLAWDGKPVSCENYSDDSIENVIEDGCLISAAVPIIANGSGSSYNIAAADSGWTTNVAGIYVYSVSETSGGTDRTVTVVQQSDIDAVKSQISTPANEVENRKALLESISEDSYKIESSFRQSVSDVVTSPKLDEVVENGVTPTATATITASIYTIDLTKVKEYIKETARVSDNELIYSVDNPFVESFTSIEGGYAGRLKTVYTVGPNISEESILEKVKGIRIGEVKPKLSDEGAKEITIKRSVPWMNSVPTDPNKINIQIITEE